MTLRIAVVNGKGGAGKTTAAILLAGEYALEGKQVLIVDADGGQNIGLWWTLSEQKGNLPANITVEFAARQDTLRNAIIASSRYDIAIFDTAGNDSTLVDQIVEIADIVVVPVQATNKEITGAGWAASKTADIADAEGRRIPALLLRTRVSIVARHLHEYRLLRPYAENMRENGYDVHLLDTELMERNPYKELYGGAGTLQIMDLTETVKKARLEVSALANEVSDWMERTRKENGYV